MDRKNPTFRGVRVSKSAKFLSILVTFTNIDTLKVSILVKKVSILVKFTIVDTVYFANGVYIGKMSILVKYEGW
jgi:hypothetical protein